MVKRRRVLAIGLALTIAATLSTAAVWLTGSAEEQAAAPAAAAAITVEAVRVEIRSLPITADAVGSLQSDESVVLRPEISGRISRILLQEGDPVERGQPLIELDSRILRADLLQAQANLRLSEANFERAETLLKQKAATVRARDEALAQVQLNRAAEMSARTRLQNAVIVAPFDGVLGFRSVSVGAYVTPADSLANLEKVDPLRVDFRLPEGYWSDLRPGQAISVTVDALPGKTFEGEIYAINPLVDKNGRSIALRARIGNPERVLTPGLFARVSVVIDTHENAVLVPESAIMRGEHQPYVYRVENGRAVVTEVALGERLTGQVEVLHGLSPDAVVVTTGQNKLRDGDTVAVAAPAKEAEA